MVNEMLPFEKALKAFTTRGCVTLVIPEIKSRLILLRERLRVEHIHVDGVILFGSQARGSATAESDIDLAIISRDFGVDRHRGSALLQRLCFDFIPFVDLGPVGVTDYLDPHPLSPILHEIKRTGTLVL